MLIRHFHLPAVERDPLMIVDQISPTRHFSYWIKAYHDLPTESESFVGAGRASSTQNTLRFSLL
jgi:hypothetical protein